MNTDCRGHDPDLIGLDSYRTLGDEHQVDAGLPQSSVLLIDEIPHQGKRRRFRELPSCAMLSALHANERSRGLPQALESSSITITTYHKIRTELNQEITSSLGTRLVCVESFGGCFGRYDDRWFQNQGTSAWTKSEEKLSTVVNVSSWSASLVWISGP